MNKGDLGHQEHIQTTGTSSERWWEREGCPSTTGLEIFTLSVQCTVTLTGCWVNTVLGFSFCVLHMGSVRKGHYTCADCSVCQ